MQLLALFLVLVTRFIPLPVRPAFIGVVVFVSHLVPLGAIRISLSSLLFDIVLLIHMRRLSCIVRVLNVGLWYMNLMAVLVLLIRLFRGAVFRLAILPIVTMTAMISFVSCVSAVDLAVSTLFCSDFNTVLRRIVSQVKVLLCCLCCFGLLCCGYLE